jgi:hypothetical protein
LRGAGCLGNSNERPTPTNCDVAEKRDEICG